ncbi:MAG TPA: FtsX-like permease family protein [Permianibacter sp.]|nr:FtsX-like permease family protein [Permianibacter sp.]
MTALRQMRWRDLWWLRGQVFATALVIACGIASFVATYGTWQALAQTQADYYRQYRFADLFAPVKRAPLSLRNKLEQVPGVAQVALRVNAEILLDDGNREVLTSARLVSLPPQQPALNGLYLRSGRWPEAGGQNEVLVSETFAKANGWRPGARIAVIMNGRREQLQVVGIALAPEFIYEVGTGALLPDAKRFGVMWMAYERLAPAVGMQGAFNEALFRLQRGANAADVIARLDILLAAYGGVGAYGRDDHPSHQFIRDEISQNRIHTTFVPAIFLSVAAFLLHVTLSRLISLQRGEIGLLKAFGYSASQIGRHYVLLALTMALLGTVPGIAIGAWLGEALTVIYNDYYHFPSLRYVLHPFNVLLALVIAGSAALFGALLPVRRAIALAPAEAMQPEPPPRFHAGPWERVAIVLSRTPVWRMTVRQLLRRRARTLFSLLAASTAMAILVLGGFGFDTLDAVMREQFDELNREQVTVQLREARGDNALSAFYRLPGVLQAEAFRQIPVRLQHGHHSKRLAVLAMSPTATLRVWRDEREQRLHVPQTGISLSQTLADQLAVKRGDTVTVTVLEGQRRQRELQVQQITEQWLGLGAYVSPETGQLLLGDGGTVSGAWLRVDEQAWPALSTTLRETPWLAASVRKADIKASMDAMLERSVEVATLINILFAGAIAFGVIYNNLRIALSERGRELASLRVLGFTRQEVLQILLAEQAVILLLAVPLGGLLGYGLCAWLSERLVTDAYRLPLVVNADTYGTAALVLLVAAALSTVVVAKRLAKMNVVDVLKTRE